MPTENTFPYNAFFLKLKLAYEKPRIVFGCSLPRFCLAFEGLAVKQW